MAVTINTDNLDFGELASSPATPSSGRVRIYAKNDGKFYRKDDTGTETELGLATVSAADVTYSPGTTGDWNGSADPGDLNDALDQLAERVKDLETAGTGLTARNAAGSVSISNTSTLTFPNGWIASGGANTAVISDVTNNYTPADSGDWFGDVPTTKTEGLDTLAQVVTDRTLQRYGQVEGVQMTNTDTTDHLYFGTYGTTIVDKNMSFDFVTNDDVIPVPATGLYLYHMTFTLEVSNDDLTLPFIIRIVDFDTSGTICEYSTSSDPIPTDGVYRGIISGYMYYTSTSNSVYVNFDNAGNMTQTVETTFRFTVTKVADI